MAIRLRYSVAFLEDALSFLAPSQAPNLPLSNLMSLPEKQDDKEKRKHLEESHHAIRPIKGHEFNPASDIERNREPESQAEGIQYNCCLRWIFHEDFAGVATHVKLKHAGSPIRRRDLLNSDRSDGQRSKCHQNLRKGENAPTPVIL